MKRKTISVDYTEEVDYIQGCYVEPDCHRESMCEDRVDYIQGCYVEPDEIKKFLINVALN